MSKAFEELLQGQSTTVVLYPDHRPVAATAVLLDPQGGERHAGVATLDPFAAEVVAVGADGDQLTLDDASDVDLERVYWLQTNRGWGARIQPAERLGAVVTLESRPPSGPVAGDDVVGLQLAFAIPGSAVTSRGKFWHIRWTVTDVAGVVRVIQQEAHVVATMFRDPVTADEVSAFAQSAHRSWARRQTYGCWRTIARQANDLVRKTLSKEGDYPHLLGNHSALEEAGRYALRVVLAAEHDLVVGEASPRDYEDTQRARMENAIREAVAAMTVDGNDNGAAERTEQVTFHTIRMDRA